MQLFVRTLLGRSLVLDVSLDSSVADLKQLIQTREGVPADCQGLVYAGRQLCEESLLSSCGVSGDSTLHLVAALRGGKGGFGALLRGQGRNGEVTTNFDAYRDLQGRRVKHQTVEKKLAEWKAGAKEREVERAKQIEEKEKERQEKRDAAQRVNVDEVLKAQHNAVKEVKSAVKDALAVVGPSGVGSKRKQQEQDAKQGAKAPEPAEKKGKMLAIYMGSDDGSDEDSSDDE